MTLLKKFMVLLAMIIAMSATNANANINDAEIQEATEIFHQLLESGNDGDQLFVEFVSELNQPPGRGSQCRFNTDCQFPARCSNGWCVRSNGNGAQCRFNTDCQFPARCSNGWCVRSNGNGDQCRMNTDCKFPARCRNGWCVR